MQTSEKNLQKAAVSEAATKFQNNSLTTVSLYNIYYWLQVIAVHKAA